MRNTIPVPLIIYLLGLSILATLNGCRNSGLSVMQDGIAHIAEKWVPDPRMGLCNITLARGTGRSLVIRGETMFPGAREEVITLAAKSGMHIIDSIRVLPDTVTDVKYHGLITVSVANIRSQPAHESEMISQAILGTPVHILKAEAGWLFIQTPDRYLGWTEGSSIHLQNRYEWYAWQQAERFIYLENTGWIYGSRDEEVVVGDIVAGAVLERTGKAPGWTEVVMPDGRPGFIPESQGTDYQLWKNKVQCTAEGLIQVARTYLGIPYQWGGATAKAVDCSGFMQSVFFRNGIILSRDASQQCNQGLNVDIANGTDSLKAGDLIFFGTRSGNSPKVSHVALYIGNTEFIHASGRVMIGSLDPSRENYDNDRRTSLLMARRIVGVHDHSGVLNVYGHPWY